MYVNTEVVTALMALKGVVAEDLTRVTGIPSSKVRLWLAGHVDEDVLPQSLQLSLLTALGVSGNTLRSDLVHIWDLHEPLIGNTAAAWAPLETVIAAFGGKAEAAYVAAEADPFFSLSPVTVYLLRFPAFMATLRVHSRVLRTSRFSPDAVEGLSWAHGNFGVLLEGPEYRRVADGEIGAKPLQRLLAISSEPSRWDILIRAAQKAGVAPEQMLRLLTAYKSKQLSGAPADAPAAAGAPADEAVG